MRASLVLLLTLLLSACVGAASSPDPTPATAPPPCRSWNDEEASARALALITDESFHADWASWTEWLGQRDGVPLPDGYAMWKGELLASRDPEFRRFLDTPPRSRSS